MNYIDGAFSVVIIQINLLMEEPLRELVKNIQRHKSNSVTSAFTRNQNELYECSAETYLVTRKMDDRTICLNSRI